MIKIAVDIIMDRLKIQDLTSTDQESSEVAGYIAGLDNNGSNEC